MMVMNYWKRLQREVVDVPSLETFHVRLDRALSSLIQLKMFLLIAGGSLKAPGNANHSTTVWEQKGFKTQTPEHSQLSHKPDL